MNDREFRALVKHFAEIWDKDLLSDVRKETIRDLDDAGFDNPEELVDAAIAIAHP